MDRLVNYKIIEGSEEWSCGIRNLKIVQLGFTRCVERRDIKKNYS